MAEESKNKTSKGWISKASNYIKNIPQDIRSQTQEKKEYWGRIGMVSGLIGVTNSFNVSPPVVWVNLMIGIILSILGFCIAITLKNSNLFWSGIAITAGFSFFSFGVRIAPSSPTGQSLQAFGVIMMLSMMLLGVCLYFKDRADSRTKEKI